jgi:hypothetical protein
LERGCARAVTGVKTEAAAEVASEEDLAVYVKGKMSGRNTEPVTIEAHRGVAVTVGVGRTDQRR